MSRFLIALLVWACLHPSILADSASHLQTVKEEIRGLEKEISIQEKASQAAKRSIEKSEKALQKTHALVNQLIAQKTTSEQKLFNVYQNLKTIQAQLDQVYANIGVLLRKQYLHKRKLDSQLLTANEMASQVRDQIYYEHIAKAQKEVIEQLIAQQEKLDILSGKVKGELKRLNTVTLRKKYEKKQLEAKKNNQNLQAQKIAQGLMTKKQRLAKLLAHEKELSALVSKLQNRINVDNKNKAVPSKDPEKKGVQVTSVADASVSGKKFIALKGKMKLPIAGRITGFFGGPRTAEGGTWKGIFISTSPQQTVRAIADGKVVYAGPLSGFGQLSIIDHGGQYLTVYGGLASIFTVSGKKIKAGEVLGKSGALESGETGLYFEIRHMRQPVNPLNWTVF